ESRTRAQLKTWKKVALIAGIAILVLAGVGFSIRQSRKGIVNVQTGKVQRQDLTSIVSASGEIKPKTYVNIGANAFGKIVKLYVKEGDHVKRGQMLAQLENVQSAADVAATKASLQSAETDALAPGGALKPFLANFDSPQGGAEPKQFDWDRAAFTFKDALIAR